MKKLFLFLALASISTFLLAQPELVWDIDQRVDSSFSSNPQNGVEADGKLYFVAGDFTHGNQIWVTDGDTARRITNISGNPHGYGPHSLVPFKGKLFFVYNDGLHGNEIWVTDGTEEGTELFIDINPLYDENWVPKWQVLGDTMYFVADDGIHGDEIWYTDGTVAGTRMLADLLGGSGIPMQLFDAFKFKGKTFLATYFGFYTTQGTAETTEKVIPIWNSSNNLPHAVFNDSIYFGGEMQGDNVGVELYKSDGTVEGTQLVADLNTGTPHSYPKDFVLVGDTLYFVAYTDTGNVNLYLTDGSAAGTKPVKIIRPGTSSADIGMGPALNGKLIFTAVDDDNGNELWITDGTEDGTKVIKNIVSGAGGSYPNEFVLIGDKIYFKAYTSSTGYELWETDGTEGETFQTKSFYPGSISGVSYIYNIDNQLILSATSPNYGGEIWFGNITNDDFEVFNIASGTYGSNPTVICEFDGKLIIEAQTLEFGKELWAYDTLAMTMTMLGDLKTGWGTGSYPQFYSLDAHYVYFRAYDDNSVIQLYRTDGTTDGTKQITSFVGSTYWTSKVVGLGDYDYFLMNGPDGNELYKTLGEPDDAVMVKDIYAGTTRGVTGEIVVLDSLLYFAADDGNTGGYALWRSNGTDAGTFLVRDVYLGLDENIAPAYMMADSNNIYFQMYDGGVYGYELYISDGTTDGTHLFKDIWTGPNSSGAQPQITLDTLTFFTAATSNEGKELWVADGDSARFLGDINQGTGDSDPYNFKVIDGTVYFQAKRGVLGDGLYKFEGDTIVEVLADIGYDFDVHDYALANGHLMIVNFIASQVKYELWQVNETGCGLTRLNDMYPFLNSQDTYGNHDSKNLFQIANTLYYQSKNSAAGIELFKYTPEVEEVFAITMVDTTFCAGGGVWLTYDFTCSFESENTFFIELSDVTGSFAAATTFDSVINVSESAGDLEFTLPIDLVESNHYRVRLKSTLPELFSADNGYDLTMGNSMTYFDTVYICQGDSVLIDGVYIKTNGQYTGDFTGFFGCDSIRETIIYIENPPNVSFTYYIDTMPVCDGQALEFSIDNFVAVDSFRIETFRLVANNENLTFTYDSDDPELAVFATGYKGNAACMGTDKIVLKDRTITNVLMGVPEIDQQTVTVAVASMPDMVDTWYWIWGDGTYTYTQDPGSHTYSAGGTSRICLIGENSCDADTSCVDVEIFNISVPGLESSLVKVYPNPATDRFVIENGDCESRILIYNVSGVEVLTLELKANERYEVNEKLEPGVYFVRAETSTDETGQMKLIIQ